MMNHLAFSNIVKNIALEFVTKWNNGILNRNWVREFQWLSPEIDNGLFELYRIGVPASHLLNAGYTENELRTAGYIFKN
jgi:hypothetical protein